MVKPSAKPPRPQPQPRPHWACADVGVAIVAIAKVPASTDTVKARCMMVPLGMFYPCIVKLKLSPTSEVPDQPIPDSKQDQIMPAPKGHAPRRDHVLGSPWSP